VLFAVQGNYQIVQLLGSYIPNIAPSNTADLSRLKNDGEPVLIIPIGPVAFDTLPNYELLDTLRE
jgi:hypothetical protein